MEQSIFDLLHDIIGRCQNYLNEHNQLPFPEDVEPVWPDTSAAAESAGPAEAAAVQEETFVGLPRKRQPKSYNAKALGLVAVEILVKRIAYRTGADRKDVYAFVCKRFDEWNIATRRIGTHNYITIQLGDVLESGFVSQYNPQ